MLTHMMREMELHDTLGTERALLEDQIRASQDARRFVCQAGVPAMIALYDTRRGGMRLEVALARQALARYPAHYSHSVLQRRRHLLLQPAFTSFTSRTPIYDSSDARTPVKQLELGRRVHFLNQTVANGRRLVRVISGGNHGLEGFIPVGQLTTPTATSISHPQKIRLVFMENPERLGQTVQEVRAGLTNRYTRLRVPQANNTNQYFNLSANSKFAVMSTGHTTSELQVNMRVPGQRERVTGFLNRDHVKTDHAKRIGERQFFIQVARRIARDRQAVFVDPASQTCINEPIPIEFFTGQDIARGIVGAAHCTNGLIDEVHIVGHGGTHGMPGTGDYADYTGLYIQELQSRLAGQPGSGAMTARNFAAATKNALQDGVNFWLHACNTGDNYSDGTPGTDDLEGMPRIPGFAEQLAGELVNAGHSGATVGGLRGIGPADSGYVRKKSFVIYPSGNRGYVPQP